MKDWYAASELMGLPGLPTSKGRVIGKAKRESWESRARKGRGGGREYSIRSFPPETRAFLSLQDAPRGIPAFMASGSGPGACHQEFWSCLRRSLGLSLIRVGKSILGEGN